MNTERTPTTAAVAELRASLRGAAAALRALDVRARAEALEALARRLLDARGAFGAEVRHGLVRSSGLSAPVVEFGLQTTLGLLRADALLALHAQRPEAPRPSLVVTVLAGNVFSAAVRPLLLPLLCGTPVLAKASSRDAVLPLALAEGLRAIDSRLAAACGVLAFAHGDGELDREWLGSAELVSAYGSDETLAAIERQLASSSRLLRHGHGYGLLAISSDALPSEAACEAVAARAALDVIAYDQRGCLSPQLVLVERGGRVSPREFAAELARALEQRALELPRGPLDPHAAAAQAQWRGVAAALGELHLGASSAVSYEDGGPLRPSPGHRNLAVHACDDTSALVARVQPLRPQLKALGVAGERTANALAGFAPYTCEVGAMQTPPLEARLDGLHPLEGFG